MFLENREVCFMDNKKARLHVKLRGLRLYDIRRSLFFLSDSLEINQSHSSVAATSYFLQRIHADTQQRCCTVLTRPYSRL
jgi:hypothetical protein